MGISGRNGPEYADPPVAGNYPLKKPVDTKGGSRPIIFGTCLAIFKPDC